MDASLAEEVAALVARTRETPRAELELRLGSHEAGRFCPGVGRGVFEQLVCDMEECGLDAEPHWTELVDYHYALRRGERARTRVTFNSDAMEVSKEHVVKREARSVLCRLAYTDGEACRVAFAREDPLDPPNACIPTHVRIKQRRCFRDVRDGCVVWSYELSRTWSAASRSVVEYLQRTTEPAYEVECELVDEGGHYLASRTDAEVAKSICLKVRLLLGDDSDGGMLQKVAPAPQPPQAAASTASTKAHV